MIRVAHQLGFVIRKAALTREGLGLADVERAMESAPLDQDDALISFGPSFGAAAVTVFFDRLTALGLVHVDDFVILDVPLPAWLRLGCTHE